MADTVSYMRGFSTEGFLKSVFLSRDIEPARVGEALETISQMSGYCAINFGNNSLHVIFYSAHSQTEFDIAHSEQCVKSFWKRIGIDQGHLYPAFQVD